MSNLLRALAWVAPGAAIRRAHALAALDATRSYDGALQGRRGAGFKGRGESANGAIGPSLSRLRDRSRDLVRNTWIGARCADILTAHAIGTGITVAFDDDKAQNYWEEWARHSSIEGERDFGGDQMIAFRSMFEGGDAGIRMIARKLDGARRVPLALQVVEGDFIDESKDGRIEGRDARLGVALGEWDAREGYWLHPAHPGEAMFLGARTSTIVPRADFCHLYRGLRAGQVRGVPFLAPVLLTVRDYADLLDAMIVKARMEACYGLAITSNNPAQNLAAAKTADDKSRDRKLESMAPGMIYRGEPGDQITAIAPSGAGQFEPIALSALMGIASGGMVTYDQMTGDLRRANYSSLRAGKIEFRRLVEQLQWLTVVPFMLNRVVERWIDTALLAGVLRNRKSGAAHYRYEYVMPAIEPIDPLKDLQADILAVRAGRMAPQEFIGAWGRDWRKVVAEIGEFWKAADAEKLILDIDPRRVNQSGAMQAPADGYATDEKTPAKTAATD
jgi:lambda family phage portal protein